MGTLLWRSALRCYVIKIIRACLLVTLLIGACLVVFNCEYEGEDMGGGNRGPSMKANPPLIECGAGLVLFAFAVDWKARRAERRAEADLKQLIEEKKILRRGFEVIPPEGK